MCSKCGRTLFHHEENEEVNNNYYCKECLNMIKKNRTNIYN